MLEILTHLKSCGLLQTSLGAWKRKEILLHTKLNSLLEVDTQILAGGRHLPPTSHEAHQSKESGLPNDGNNGFYTGCLIIWFDSGCYGGEGNVVDIAQSAGMNDDIDHFTNNLGQNGGQSKVEEASDGRGDDGAGNGGK